MTTDQLRQLATLLTAKREAFGLTIPEVSRLAGVNRGTLWRLELGMIASPKGENLQAIGEVLGISAGDLFATIGWMPPNDLPSIRPYLRSKYHDLPPEAVAEIEAEFDAVARKHGLSFTPGSGPQAGEDE